MVVVTHEMAFARDVSDKVIFMDKLMAFPSSADLTALEQSISERNADGMKKEAHKIRKCAEKLGLHEIAKLASRIEEVNHEKAVSDFAELKTARDAVCSIIENAV